MVMVHWNVLPMAIPCPMEKPLKMRAGLASMEKPIIGLWTVALIKMDCDLALNCN